MRFTLFLSTVVLVTASVASSTQRSVSSIEGYAVTEVQWNGEFQGQVYNVTGTIEDLHAHFLSIDPSYELPAHNESDVIISPRWNCCPVPGQNFALADGRRLEQGVKYLYRINRDLSIRGNSCGRISCSYDSAIYWCNQVPEVWTVRSGWLGAHAETILHACYVGDWPPNICGQNFDANGYNIVVKYDWC